LDVTYTISAAAAGGQISSRDFVNVRKTIVSSALSEDYVIASYGIEEHRSAPMSSSIVRGLVGPSGYIVRTRPNDANRAEVIWILNSDLRGWLPQKLVNWACTSVLVDWIQHLRLVLSVSRSS
jgi:hypothetical protein